MTKPVNIAVTADTKKAQNAFKELELGAKNMGTNLGGLGQVFGKFAAMAGGSLIMGKVAGFMKDGALAAADEEQAVAKLTTVIQNNTSATDEQATAADKWLTAMQGQLGISEDELRPAFSNLVAATKDVTKAQDLMSIAVDIAAGRGLSLETVTVALAKAQMGNVSGLQRLGIATKDAGGQTLSFDQIMKNAATTFGGTAQAAADTTTGKMERMKLMFGELKETLGTALLPIINNVVGAISAVAQWFGNLPEPVQKIILLVGSLVAGISGLALAFGPIMGAIGGLMPMIGGLGGVFAALTGPIGIAIAAIAGISAAVLLCIKYHEEIKAALIVVWDTIKGALSAAWDFIKSTAETVWNAIKQFFKDWWPLVLGIFTGGIGLVIGVVVKNWDAIKKKTAEIWDGIKTTLSNVWNDIKDSASTIWNGVKDTLSGIWTEIKDAFGRLWDGMKEAWNTAAGWIGDIPGKIKGFFTGAGRWLYDIGKSILTGLLDGLKAAWTNTVDFLKGLGSKIKSLKGPIEKDRVLLEDEGKAIIEGLGKGMAAAWPGVEDVLSGMTRRMAGGATTAPAGVTNAQRYTNVTVQVSGNDGVTLGRQIATILGGI